MDKKIKTKKFLIITSLILVISLVINPEASVTSASRGIKLWFDTVFPALFPFFVTVELLNKSGFVKILGILMEPIMRPLFNIPGCGAFTFAIGIMSGYPMGAKITSEMREEYLVTKTEGERMLAYCNNSGPLFILGAVGVGMFKIPMLGNLLLLTHILACITVAFIFRFYKRKKEIRDKTRIDLQGNILQRIKNAWSAPMECDDLGSLLGQTIKNSLNTILAIGGFIIFFSVIIAVLQSSILPVISHAVFIIVNKAVDIDIINAVFCGFFEITTGSSLAASGNSDIIVRASAVALIIGWAGLSVHAQVMSIITDTDLSPKPYLAGKAIQSIFAGLYTYLFLSLNSNFLLKAQTVTLINEKEYDFLNGLYYNNLLTGYYKYSLYFLAAGFLLVCIKYLLCSSIKKLF